mmetsp:Transcript_20800/g.31500  ORF Transcript_20800/g.31500 Transcript_20800/m.31500 type:complete len:122 (-) Transcript_20800:537-902(-)
MLRPKIRDDEITWVTFQKILNYADRDPNLRNFKQARLLNYFFLLTKRFREKLHPDLLSLLVFLSFQGLTIDRHLRQLLSWLFQKSSSSFQNIHQLLLAISWLPLFHLLHQTHPFLGDFRTP